ncbi:MAG TPA: ketol-acid reductoisomerase [Rhizomicrobium sp.]|jgi:ketol-acid reductoisomerase|nr:ketol-acid reductoisomerase [Rhizomicrobium sp.]
MQIYYDRDTDPELIRSKRIAVLGFGSQGHAHALNLRDSGVTEIAVAGRPGASLDRAKETGFHILSNADAAAWADVIVMGAPDESQPDIYRCDLAPHMKQGAALLFVHGFAIHFHLIEPRPDLDVVMVAPKGQGHAMRREYLRGGGVPGLIAIQQNASGKARELALSYAAAIGSGRAGIMATTFGEECEADLFSEQAILCGGLMELIRAGFDTLVDAGYAPEIAYFECLHEVKLIVDLIYVRGIAGMNTAISNTAEYGEYVAGPRIVTDETRAEMKRILADIRSGRFARDWVLENMAGQPSFKAMRARAAAHPIEAVGERLRAMMPWLADGRNQDRK